MQANISIKSADIIAIEALFKRYREYDLENSSILWSRIIVLYYKENARKSMISSIYSL